MDAVGVATGARSLLAQSELAALIAEAVASGRFRDEAEAAGHFARLLKGGGLGLDSESELIRLIDGIGEGFYALDSAFRIVRFNDAASRHFGVPAVSVLGRVLWDVFPAATDTELGKLFRRTVQTGLDECRRVVPCAGDAVLVEPVADLILTV